MNFNVFDIETYTHKNELIAFCLCYSYEGEMGNLYSKDCVDDFLDLILKKNKNQLWFAHNLTFDGSFLINSLSKKNIKFEYFLINNSIYSITISNKEESVKIKCSYRFFPHSLKLTDKFLDCGKKININLKKINKNNINNHDIKKEVIAYCEKDVGLVLEILNIYNKLLSKWYLNWYLNCNSISSISLNMFVELFNKYDIKISNKLEIDLEFRQSYFGGRCEIFGNPKKDEKIYHYDFKGMYSQVMLEDFPIENFIVINNPETIENPGFYHVEVESDLEIPILPIRSITGKLLFPNGFFKGLYWYEELLYFKKKGGKVLKIIKSYEFKKKEKVFRLFSETLSNLRKNDSNSNFLFKLINNSLYGRLGLAYENKKNVIINESELEGLKKKNEILKYTKINNLYIVTYKKKVEDTKYIRSNVIYASIITSKARIKLHKGFEDVKKYNGRILYTDTDSIFAAYRENVDDQSHGSIKWDCEKNDTKIKKALFALPKTYALIYDNNKYSIKMKGITNPNINFEEFCEKFFKKQNHEFISSNLKNKNFKFNEINLIKIINFNKMYDKRIFNEDYTETKSLYIDEINL